MIKRPYRLECFDVVGQRWLCWSTWSSPERAQAFVDRCTHGVTMRIVKREEPQRVPPITVASIGCAACGSYSHLARDCPAVG